MDIIFWQLPILHLWTRSLTSMYKRAKKLPSGALQLETPPPKSGGNWTGKFLKKTQTSKSGAS